MSNKKRFALIISLAVTILAIIFLAYSQVDNSFTTEDLRYIGEYVREANLRTIPKKRSYEDEKSFVIDVQKAVLHVASKKTGLPYSTNREPKDVYLAKTGLCYDRSRVIEKILRSYGFKTRHIFICSTKETSSKFKSLLTRGISSHAVSEVLTSKGWLVVDSNHPWVSIDSKGNPISILKIQSDVEKKQIEWNNASLPSIYREPFTFLYGLYSRHGKFYPPFNFVPDINYGELLYNFM